MAKAKIFSIYDSKAEAYIQPWFAPTTSVGKRLFTAAANNEDSDFNRFAADYTLFEIGTFDSETGKIEMYPAQENLGNAMQYIEHDSYEEGANVADLRKSI